MSNDTAPKASTGAQVVFLHGPAASGKHTVGTRLSQRTGLPLFHNHLTVDLVTTLFEFGSGGFRRLRASIWLAAFSEAAAAGRSFIFTFHPEATVDRALIDDLVAAIEATGGRVHFVELRCSRAGVLERLGHPNRARFGKLVDRELYQRIERSGGFEFPPMPRPLLVVDTERHDADEAAALIHAALEGNGR